jgi:hypothetical protein
MAVAPDFINSALGQIRSVEAQGPTLGVLICVEPTPGSPAAIVKEFLIDTLNADHGRAVCIAREADRGRTATYDQEFIRRGLQEHHANPRIRRRVRRSGNGREDRRPFAIDFA